MMIYFVQDEDNIVRGLYSTFEKAQEKAREICVEPWLRLHGDNYDKEDLEEILEEFEATGYIEGVCYIEGYTVDK